MTKDEQDKFRTWYDHPVQRPRETLPMFTPCIWEKRTTVDGTLVYRARFGGLCLLATSFGEWETYTNGGNVVAQGEVPNAGAASWPLLMLAKAAAEQAATAYYEAIKSLGDERLKEQRSGFPNGRVTTSFGRERHIAYDDDLSAEGFAESVRPALRAAAFETRVISFSSILKTRVEDFKNKLSAEQSARHTAWYGNKDKTK